MKRGITALLAVLSVGGSLVSAQDAATPHTTAPTAGHFVREWFETRPWYEPLVADPRGAHVNLIALAVSREFPYMLDGGARRMWDISLGKEIPFVLREKGTTGDRTIMAGGWGFGFWLPVSVHLVEDFHDAAHPIVNTDYRFGLAFKIAHGFADRPRDRVFCKVQFGHESSHVGDEFLLNAMERYGAAFERVDVTSQYLEGGASWDHALTNGRHQVTFRVSTAHTLPRKGNGGYYVAQLPDGRSLTPSVRNVEPAVGIELTPLGTKGAGLMISLDARQKTVFNFHRVSSTEREQAQWSYSLVAGIRPLNRRSRGTPEFVAKAYYGANPNGLFRTQTRYWLFGGGLYVRV